MDAGLLQVAGLLLSGGALVEAIRYLAGKDKNRLDDNESMRSQMLQYHQMMTQEMATLRKEHNEMHTQYVRLQKELFDFERKSLILEDERNEWQRTAEKMKSLYEEMRQKYEALLQELSEMKQTTKTLEKKVDANISVV